MRPSRTLFVYFHSFHNPKTNIGSNQLDIQQIRRLNPVIANVYFFCQLLLKGQNKENRGRE